MNKSRTLLAPIIGIAAVMLLGYTVMNASQLHIKFTCLLSALLFFFVLLIYVFHKTKGSNKLSEDEFMNRFLNYASIVSHELKNPLASLKNVAYYLSQTSPKDDPTTVKMISTLSSEIDRLNERIQNFVDRPRIKTLNLQDADLGTITTNVLAKFNEKASSIKKEISSSTCFADSKALERAIENIILNSLEAISSDEYIHVSVRSHDTFAECTIFDTGKGMDPKTLTSATSPMFTTKQKQLGLGLTVAQHIVRLHNGTLKIRSQQEKGTSITIQIPRQGKTI